jgi:ATP phosphoribosyltransferase
VTNELDRVREDRLIMALPNGRILGEVMPLLRRIGIEPEPAFDDPASRQLRFGTSEASLDLIRVRSFDAATFVAFGAAQLGIAGNDVLMEFDYSEIYAPLDLDVGHCRLAVAATADGAQQEDLRRSSHIRVATKYPEVTRRHFAARGLQAECIKLNGAIELAPRLGLCRYIVDLVQTGATLKANGLTEIEPIAEVSSRLIVNRPALKTRPEEVGGWIERFRDAIVQSSAKKTTERGTLTHPALRAGSPLSRTAGEGAERSEAGEGGSAAGGIG